MSHPGYDLIVLRYGELFLKGQNRGRFEALLERNVRRAISPQGAAPLAAISRGQGRLFLSCQPDQAEQVLARVQRVFGLSSISPALATPQQLEAISRAAVTLTQAVIPQARPASFRVKARRSDKSFPTPSPEIGSQVGSAVVEATGLAVNLTEPDLVIGVEVGPRRTFVFCERLPGAGGLPVGASGQVTLLLSGGIDSPVAGHLLQKRGCTVRPIYFHSPPYTSARAQDKVCQLAALLQPNQGELELDVVRFTAIQERIRDHAPLELAVVLYRRAMMRIAARLAQAHRSLALATGENLGQVASQTLENLACIEAAAELPVLRPLLTFDKVETIALAQAIGSYALSIEPYADCCSLFVPRHPSTRTTLKAAERAEAPLALEALIEQAVAEVETIRLAG